MVMNTDVLKRGNGMVIFDDWLHVTGDIWPLVNFTQSGFIPTFSINALTLAIHPSSMAEAELCKKNPVAIAIYGSQSSTFTENVLLSHWNYNHMKTMEGDQSGRIESSSRVAIRVNGQDLDITFSQQNISCDQKCAWLICSFFVTRRIYKGSLLHKVWKLFKIFRVKNLSQDIGIIRYAYSVVPNCTSICPCLSLAVLYVEFCDNTGFWVI